MMKGSVQIGSFIFEENVISTIYLYHTEDSDIGGSLSAAASVPMLEQFIYMLGDGERACIHPEDASYAPSAPLSFPTLKDAQEAYPDHEWVYLDHTADDDLSTFVHPAGDAVYVVGHDANGYSGSILGQTRLKVFDKEGHAIPCLIAAVCDRWSKSWQ